MTPSRPNVLLVVFDTARADAFEPYGAAPGSSPAVGQLAREGQARTAFAAAPWTIPSHASMFSGLLPQATGVPGARPDQMIAGSARAIPALRDRWLPSVFADAGYQTAGVSANGLVSASTGFDLGFELFIPIQSGYWCSWTGRTGWALQSLRASTDEGAERIEWLVRQGLAEARDKPFFWFVNLTECHSPYMPRSPYNPLGPLGRVRASQEWGRYLKGETHRTTFNGSQVPEPALRRMRRLYAGCVKLLDAWLARVLEALDQHRLLDDTIIVVTSDHGENLGEGGLLGHAYSVDDRLIRVPFVTAGPVAADPGAGVFSQVDFPGWLADQCGLRDHPWASAEPPGDEAVAIAEFVPYGDESDPAVAKLAREWDLGEVGMRRLTERLRCATNGRRKLVRSGDREALYDLEADPLETSPLTDLSNEAAPFREELNVLRGALDRSAHDGPPSRPEQPGTFPEADDVAALRRQMEMLGYM